MNTEPAEMSEELMDELPSDTEPVTEPMPELEQTVADLQEVADVPADYEELESLRQELAEMRRELVKNWKKQLHEKVCRRLLSSHYISAQWTGQLLRYQLGHERESAGLLPSPVACGLSAGHFRSFRSTPERYSTTGG